MNVFFIYITLVDFFHSNVFAKYKYNTDYIHVMSIIIVSRSVFLFGIIYFRIFSCLELSLLLLFVEACVPSVPNNEAIFIYTYMYLNIAFYQ